jgi:hypothetical protein
VDTYIDNHEGVLYGRYFHRHSEPLVGASNVFNVGVLREIVLLRAENLHTAMTVADSPRSVVRTGRTEVDVASDEVLDRLRRFYYFLQSLPDSANVDVGAFFANRRLGNLSQQKPEDMMSRAETVLRGFTTPSSARVPNGVVWQTEIVDARTALADALVGKLGAANSTSTAVGSVARARAELLHVYNKVAKPAIRGLLAELGREGELRLYFRDLQVNEGRPRPPGTPAEPDDQPGGDVPAGDDAPYDITP